MGQRVEVDPCEPLLNRQTGQPFAAQDSHIQSDIVVHLIQTNAHYGAIMYVGVQ